MPHGVSQSATPAPAPQLAQIEHHCRQRLEANPQDAEAWCQLGLLALTRGQPAAAIEPFSHAAACAPTQPLYLHHLATAFQATSQNDKALGAFEAVVRLRPECGEAHNNVGIALAQLGKRELAEAAFRRAIHHRPDFPEALNNLGNSLVEQGQHDEALASFRAALSLQPTYSEAHHNLGFALARLRRTDEAAASYREALRLKPNYLEAQLGLANLLREAGRLDEALAGYREATRLQPRSLEARVQVALALQQLGRIDEAIAGWHQALLFHPQNPEVYNYLGVHLAQANRLDEANAAFRQAVHLRPDFAEAINNLGNTLLRQDLVTDAVALFRQAVDLRQDYAQPHCNLGCALLQQGHPEEAIASYREALRLQPDYVDAHFNLGNALRAQARPGDAVACYRQALELQPEHQGARLNLGVALAEQGEFDAAEVAYRAVVAQQPECAEAFSSLGVTRLHQGRAEEALEFFDQAVALKPDEADLHLNRALALLLVNDFERGWVEYEWRWKSRKSLPRPFTAPPWDGSPLPEGTLLLHAEQGFGDTLQFARYAELVRQRVGTVILECPAPLKGLMASCLGIDTVVEHGAPLPPFDAHAPLLTLPRLLGTTPDTIPAPGPYLVADPGLRRRWRPKLGAGQALKVGLAWQGNPRFAGDRYRSVKLAQLAPLAEVGHARFFSLQKGTGADQLKELAGRWPIVDVSGPAGDFQDTAAIMAELDLVIAVDTAVAHLAGALEVPVWILLPFNADWRWQRDREDSPWYPSARLFRQRHWADWGDVIARVATALAHWQRPPRRFPINSNVFEIGTRLAHLERHLAMAPKDQSARRERSLLGEIWRQAFPADEGPRRLTQLIEADDACAQVLADMARSDFEENAPELIRALLRANADRDAIRATLLEAPAATKTPKFLRSSRARKSAKTSNVP